MPASPRTSHGRARAIPLVLAVLSAVATAVVAPPAAGAYPTANVEIDGHGWGHGRGMGQYGALGYAVVANWSYTQILGHYYSNTSTGNIGNPEVTVILRAFDRKDTIVVQERGHMTTNAAPASTTFTALRAVQTGSNVFQVYSGPGCGGPWSLIHSGITGPVVMQPQNRNEDRQEMLQACEPGGAIRWYRGELRAVQGLDGTQRTINALDMQNYLKGTVPRESPASWGDLGGGAGLNALKAQAVAARSYAASGDLAPYAKTCDTTECQVYGGRALQSGNTFIDLEDSRSNKAVTDTSGEVRTLNGSPARTEYSSSTGGWTAGGTFPAVEDLGDAISSNPNHNWHASIPVSQVQAAYPQVGTLNAVVVTKRNGLGDMGGRATEVQVQGSNSTATVSGASFQFALGLKSDWYAVVASAPPPTTTATTVAPAPTTTAPPPVTLPPGGGGQPAPSGSGGYWIAAADLAVWSFGNVPVGTHGGMGLVRPIVGIAPTVSGSGYWLVAADGGIFTFGDAPFLGSRGGAPLKEPMVGMAATPSGKGYWTVATDGGIFTYGDAPFHGSMGAVQLAKPMVGMAGTGSGNGYWTVASDGGIFTFGDAQFKGSMGGQPLKEPIVGMARTPSGQGYWLVASDGGIFTFGDAQFKGSTGALSLARPIVGMSSTPTGQGYWLVAADGGVFTFGDAQFFGSVPGVAPNSTTQKVGMAIPRRI